MTEDPRDTEVYRLVTRALTRLSWRLETCSDYDLPTMLELGQRISALAESVEVSKTPADPVERA